MRRIPRKLLTWGGATVVAGAGFAFMASNTMAGSSAGDGSGTVSGYTVTNISWVPVEYTSSHQAFVGTVSFTLKAKGTTATAKMVPRTVAVYTDKTGTANSGLIYYGVKPKGTWNIGSGMSQTCKLTGVWSVPAGTGKFVCTFTNHTSPKIATFNSIDVEANR